MKVSNDVLNVLVGQLDEVQQMHGLLLWALWHHQGASSPIGQPIRRALGIDAHARLTAKQVTLAKQVAGSLPFNALAQGPGGSSPDPAGAMCCAGNGEGDLQWT